MSFKAFLFIVLVIALGIFMYLKIEVMGSPNSTFNRTTRFSLAAYPFMRTILGLHSVGDSRSEYLKPGGVITIQWFKPQSENDDSVNQSLMDKFAALVANYTGRQVQAMNAGAVDDGAIPLANLGSYSFRGASQVPSGTLLQVFFTEDYTPRPDNELSTTYQDSGIVISLQGHRNFLQQYPQDLSQYLLSSMLYEFGNQIGMQQTAGGSQDCILNLHSGINGAPLEALGLSEPQDFCPAEQAEIQNLKLQFGQ